MTFDSITNRGEFFSNHYLDAIVAGDLNDLRRQWSEAEAAHKDTARSRLRGLSKAFFAARAAVTEADDASRADAARLLNGHVLEALGFTVRRQTLELTHTTTDELDVPVAGTVETGTGLLLVALDADIADDVDDLFASGNDAQGRLLEPVLKVGEKQLIDHPADAVGALFATDDPPRWVVVVAGRIVLLAERARWAEGRFLAVDLDTALERNDTKAKGELETIAAIFSTDALVPDAGQAVIDELTEKSHKHAVGVSKELREGIRQSIEILANEVIEQRLAANLAVYSGANRVDPRELTTQCLRFLYRLLVLLYAESRPELGIVPANDDVYTAGYSLDRLRELTLVDLDTDDARNGTHLDHSLRALFELVNGGYHADHAQQVLSYELDPAEPVESYEDYLQFPGLDAQLFEPTSTPLLSRITLRNEPLQKVLKLLMLSREGQGRNADRGFISYAQLGINQLGAVYEGLMAYTGFFADTDLYEVAKGGDPTDGTWVLPVKNADEYPSEVFVSRTDPLTGREERILHPKGSFVFRLSGRDRQRSASYYTPEVLTRCVVKHALAELLGLDDYAPKNGSSGITEAQQILDLTICEPALGSGAFLNEAINQLSAEYLRRRQAELGETLDPEHYSRELQKVKAHFALHQSYGVDLNATAVELAEVSLWLNCMHPGLKAPWFGMQLRRGNSLIGCRRATWRTSQLKHQPWAQSATTKLEPPTHRPLAQKLNSNEVHYFLLPSRGWAAVADRNEAKELRPNRAAALAEWREVILDAPAKTDAHHLVSLADCVERLWAMALNRLEFVRRSLHRPLAVWKATPSNAIKPISRQTARELLEHPASALVRLRAVMDAWVGMWFWPTDADVPPPTWYQWQSALDDLLSMDNAGGDDQLPFESDAQTIIDADSHIDERKSVPYVRRQHPWLDIALDLAQREGAWHWELEFAPNFVRGGFDLQVGNPPWVRLKNDHALTLAESRPATLLLEEPATPVSEAEERLLLRQSAEHAAGAGFLSSPDNVARVPNGGTNLYRAFMGTFWSNSARNGVQGVLHPDAHYYDVRSSELRAAAYCRLLRLYQFTNQKKLFEEIGNTRPYAINIYSRSNSSPDFLRASKVFHPSTVDSSLEHDGLGPIPTLKTTAGEWNLAPHKRRFHRVTDEFLTSSASILGGRDATRSARLVNILVSDEMDANSALSSAPRLRSGDYVLDPGMTEGDARSLSQDGVTYERDLERQILQSPHFAVANPLAQATQPVYRNHRSYEMIDLEGATSLGRRVLYSIANKVQEGFDGIDSRSKFRIFYKRWCDPNGERTLEPAIMPPRVSHVESTYSMHMPSARKLTLVAALWSSICIDYLVKVLGNDTIRTDVIESLPIVTASPLAQPMLLRIMRLNCLGHEYADLWSELFDSDWNDDSWSLPGSTVELGGVTGTLSSDSALRKEFDRRRALVEIDALSAIMLGLTSDQLCVMYRTQFPVLRKYESGMVFDSFGRRICKHNQSAGYRQTQLQVRARNGDLPGEWKSLWKLYGLWEVDPESVDWRGYYEPPFYRPDREAEMTAAYDEFQRRIEIGQYSDA